MGVVVSVILFESVDGSWGAIITGLAISGGVVAAIGRARTGVWL